VIGPLSVKISRRSANGQGTGEEKAGNACAFSGPILTLEGRPTLAEKSFTQKSKETKTLLLFFVPLAKRG
jgi:hypothetical protein